MNPTTFPTAAASPVPEASVVPAKVCTRVISAKSRQNRGGGPSLNDIAETCIGIGVLVSCGLILWQFIALIAMTLPPAVWKPLLFTVGVALSGGCIAWAALKCEKQANPFRQ